MRFLDCSPVLDDNKALQKLRFEKKFMPKKIRIPTPLRKLTNNEEQVEVNAATIGEAREAFAT